MRRWLQPPQTLLLSLFLLTLAAVSALGWFGWKLLEQERVVEAQRLQERLEQEADRVTAAVRGAMAESAERLSAGLPVKDALVLVVKEKDLEVTPAGRLLYFPFPSSQREANPTVFAEAEMFEFVQNELENARQGYERLLGSPDAAVRAGALVRLARVLRKMGRGAESREAYARLASYTGVKVAGAPADLVARRELGLPLREDLLGGRWHLTRGQFHFYWPGPAQPPAEALVFSEIAWRVWEGRNRDTSARGQETLWIGGRPYFLMWRGRAVMVARPESFLIAGVRFAMVDSEGRVLAGEKGGSGRAVVRTAAESQLPWTIYVSASERPGGPVMPMQQRFLLLGIAVMVTFLVCGTYFIGRAIRREAAVMRMQSEFVSAVSHEFRSPLTTLRQLSEILALGRVPSDDRRQLYYETLVRETTRLQRVVEALLNFGRMEAGARQYRFEELDASQLVRRVVSEFEQQIAGSGHHVELSGTESQCLIDGDPDAISVALRNLLDNAVKYSPQQPTVWVEWERKNEFVAIHVRDNGLGVPEQEKKAIFQKFVRGSAADMTNVKGSGVGLAMVRHIVTAHGGEIMLASRSGQGSTFTMLLPAVTR